MKNCNIVIVQLYRLNSSFIIDTIEWLILYNKQKCQYNNEKKNKN